MFMFPSLRHIKTKGNFIRPICVEQTESVEHTSRTYYAGNKVSLEKILDMLASSQNHQVGEVTRLTMVVYIYS